ncbi:hypothetical protein QBC44DRAFT_77868 [Cladorrhinum sp. PSN332]|nr:hypothetical protein QBC44DRAFT_77868 [Cladorrhinum sp. PSN332]
MLEGELDLGSIKLAGRRTRLSLTLESSCAFSFLNATRKELPTAVELAEASSSGQIWISKAGSCQLNFATLINGEPLDDSSADTTLVSMIANLAAECQVWQEIGLELRLKHARETDGQQHMKSTYFLHHPDLSSGLIAPQDVSAAQFQGLNCNINFEFEITHEGPQDALEDTEIHLANPEEPSQKPPRHNHGLRRNPKRTGKAQRAMGDALSKSRLTKTPAVKTTLGCAEDLEEGDIVEMAYMMDIALRKLIGIKKASPGIKFGKTTPVPALVEIAPAVWNLQYLQSMAVHSKIIPAIAAGFSRLTNARSASLRDKVQRLAHRAGAQNDIAGKLDTGGTSSDEIKKRLWVLCQTSIRADPTKMVSTQRRTNGKRTQPDLFEWEVMEEYYDSSNYMLEAGHEAAGDTNYYGYEEEGYTYGEMDEEMTNLPETHHNTLEEVPAPGDLNPGPFSGGLTGSSEGEYFYMDAEGNMIPVERENIVVEEEEDDDGLEEWETSSQLETLHLHEGLHAHEKALCREEEGFRAHEEGIYTYEQGFHARDRILDEAAVEYITYSEEAHSDLPEGEGQGYVEYYQEDYTESRAELEHHDGYESEYGEADEEGQPLEGQYTDDERYIIYHEEQYSAGDST